METALEETEKKLTRGRVEIPVSLCFAIVEGYELLLRHLLKEGLDPNEPNINGMTPLVGEQLCF